MLNKEVLYLHPLSSVSPYMKNIKENERDLVRYDFQKKIKKRNDRE